MGCLVWMLAMAGIGGASLAFATAAPGSAWWVLALIVVALAAGPHLLQWWLRRAKRTERLAAAWWSADPLPIEVAFLSGGPDRVIDLVIADMVVDGRLTVDDAGRLAPGLPDLNDGPSSLDAGFRAEILARLAHGSTDVAALRFSTRSTAAMPRLWRTAARQRLVLPSWRREHTPWYLAGAVVAVGYAVAVARDKMGRDVLFVGAVAALALGVASLWRARFLTGYAFDPRTAAGLRAAELARIADRPQDRRHRIAVQGLHAASELRPGVPDPHRLPPSRWHVPWYARRVREASTPWWLQVAQAPTDYTERLRRPDGAHETGPRPDA